MREKTSLKEKEMEQSLFLFLIVFVVAFRWNVISITIRICNAVEIKRADLILPGKRVAVTWNCNGVYSGHFFFLFYFFLF